MKGTKIFLSFLLLTIAGLTYMFYTTYNDNQSKIATLEAEINELKLQNENLKSELDFSDAKLNSSITNFNNLQAQYNSVSALLTQYKDEAKMWKDKYLAGNDNSSNLQTTFTSTKELVNAVRSKPTQYANQEVTVIGTFYIYKTEKAVFDLPDGVEVPSSSADVFDVRVSAYKTLSGIDVVFSDNAMDSVLRRGDYIKITGVVSIGSDGPYLKDCSYELLQLRENR